MRKIAAVLLLATLWVSAVPRPTLGAEERAAAIPVTAWDVSQVVEQAKPSVVAVVATLTSPEGEEHPRRALGTGVVYREDGYIITAAHVVEGATRIDVVLSAGVTAVALPTEVWSDALSDVAVIRIDARDLTPAEFADSDAVKPGQLAIAVGNPLGLRLGNTVSVGVISGVGRSLGTGYSFLQTDAAVNPGNSGGPLLDARGRVVGITSAKIVEGDIEGLGFAIPGNTAREMAERLITEKEIVRSWLGLKLEESPAAAAGLPTEEGLKVIRVKFRGPASSSLRPGDEVLSLDTKPVHTLDEVEAVLADIRPGYPVYVRVKREGKIETFQVFAGKRPNVADAFKPEDDVGRGVWKHLDISEVVSAIDYAKQNERREFWEWASDYIRGGSTHSLLLQTEFLHIAARHWVELQAKRPLTQGLFLESMGHIQGKLEFLMFIEMIEPAPYKDQYDYERIWVIQGDHNFQCVHLQDWLPIPLMPSEGRNVGHIAHPCWISSDLVNPQEPLTVFITSPYVGAVQYTYNLGALR